MTDTLAPETEAPTANGIPWTGVLAPEGVLSGDGRKFRPESLSWRTLPLPLSWQKETATGHDGAMVVGHIDRIWRDGTLMKASGFFDDSPEAEYVIRQLNNGSVRGVSVDVDDMTSVFETKDGVPVHGDDLMLPLEDGEEPPVMVVTKGRIAGATICAIPAFMEAFIQVEDEQGGAPPKKQIDTKEVLDAAADALLKSGKTGEELQKAADELLVRYEVIGETPPDALVEAAGLDTQALDAYRAAFVTETASFETVDEGDWEGGAENYTPEEWIKSTLIHLEPGADQAPDTKGLHKLPVRTPSGTLNRRAIHAAASILAGARGGVKAPSKAKAEAAKTIVRLYREELAEEPPKSVQRLAGERVSTLQPLASLAAAGVLAFSNPELDGPTALTISDDGAVYGHLAVWGTCHIGFGGQCVTPPRSRTNYAYFLTGERDGVPVGQITMGTGHAEADLGLRPAIDHYDNSGLAVADVTCGEDEYGLWVSGWLRESVSEEQRDALRAGALSGDWRRIGGNLELVAALAVNVPGFPIPRLAAASWNGKQSSLVASGVLGPMSMAWHRSEGVDVTAMTAEVMHALDRREKARRLAASIGRDKRTRALAAAARMRGD